MSTFFYFIFLCRRVGIWRMSTTCRHKRMSTTALITGNFVLQGFECIMDGFETT